VPLNEYKETLRAMLKGDAKRAHQLSAEIENAPWQQSGALATAVCAILADERFVDNDDSEAVQGFVAEMMQDYATADPPLKPFMCEVVVRVALGESELLKGLDVNDLTVHQMAFMNKVVQDAELTDSEIDGLLDEAEQLLKQM
jgi:hypothetical protein